MAQTDPTVGTWVLNVAKSKYDPGPPPKSSTLTIVAAGQGHKIEAKGVDAAGNPTGTQYTASYDGKDVPVTLTGSQDYDTIALKKVDAQRVEGTRKKAGKVVQTYSRVITADGKTMIAHHEWNQRQGPEGQQPRRLREEIAIWLRLSGHGPRGPARSVPTRSSKGPRARNDQRAA